jgi:hypothetical protein
MQKKKLDIKRKQPNQIWNPPSPIVPPLKWFIHFPYHGVHLRTFQQNCLYNKCQKYNGFESWKTDITQIKFKLSVWQPMQFIDIMRSGKGLGFWSEFMGKFMKWHIFTITILLHILIFSLNNVCTLADQNWLILQGLGHSFLFVGLLYTTFPSPNRVGGGNDNQNQICGHLMMWVRCPFSSKW